VPVLIAIAALAALLLTASPDKVVRALERFDLIYLPVLLILSLTFYLLQGVRWWTLLHPAGIKITWRRTVLFTVTGQATALLPLGELTRAILVSKATDTGLGRVVATESVQELLFAGLLFAVAIPGALEFRPALIFVCMAVVAIILILVILTVNPIFCQVHRVVAKTPVLKRMIQGIDELQAVARDLLTHRYTYTWLWISAIQALMAVSLLWFAVEALAPGRLSWYRAALVYGVTQGASWVSLSPGGLGAFELSTAGFLLALGVPYSSATAGAIIFRLADKGFATLLGMLCYFEVKRLYHWQGVNLFKLRESGGAVARL
ncbi:MAG TPA: lysylphosphatidylglycerol synthase transmembrane domain-containing protein, partial [Candidatus Sulfotelmatobacter sp.]|nr:lysylphosphatidylglycerol synthase transmembrane domain-containing protein [Candidatus Sulfotelmatobacter sp.]